MPWNGEDRRKDNRPDAQDMHDTIIKIDTNLSNFMRRFDEHIVHDDKHFVDFHEKINALQRYLWMGLGGLGVIIFLIEKVFK